ncbi:hypothetical protein EST38_g11286 [Candolleomyces aberdarensis]|uniref:Uncharacterized protein n=1 Tax=Candolleomyces aberdarensis TaxID=2316362 RepID=A0A4Q2D7I9_9AGAR|nr:hypothetical protein EST38_g11286 [Candolleomyces aberdarensis]
MGSSSNFTFGGDARSSVPRPVQREISHQIDNTVERLEIGNNTRDERIDVLEAKATRNATQIKAIEAQGLRRDNERHDLSAALQKVEGELTDKIKEAKLSAAGASKVAQAAANTAEESKLIATQASEKTRVLSLDLARTKSALEQQKRDHAHDFEELNAALARQKAGADGLENERWAVLEAAIEDKVKEQLSCRELKLEPEGDSLSAAQIVPLRTLMDELSSAQER